MLAELKAQHEAIREGIARLRIETGRGEPDEGRLAAARLSLSRISGRRKALIECSILPLLHDVPPEDARRLADFRRRSAEIAIGTSEHIARWTMRSILADWQGYQAASRLNLASMETRMAEEEALLYPLLEERQASSGT